MNEVKTGLPATLAFRLGVLGTRTADRFAERLAAHDLKPKHAGLLAALDHGAAASQQELAGRMEVAPSLVVALADHLERLGAIERVRDIDDRRRQVLKLTAHGRTLLERCEREARAIDAELMAPLSAKDRAALHRALGALAAEAGLPT
ncbi:MarR family winged helix-turn-helix transcriptional regulator [Nocardia pseudobrasiliensis]|uniref:DNA-binding MarR family transcriptional regulator n=1 Tax=Nocardia pseudobrasiliensis TaxID=45979 RepID=A0A370HZ83_9NOCA|nr:MarR family transcriptional regulator [Nocardia pseudobrasiliensis]RDI63778.1 DNA-binding MarR family transcriptional regulator [Nocardia pseudobrasiliensis]